MTFNLPQMKNCANNYSHADGGYQYGGCIDVTRSIFRESYLKTVPPDFNADTYALFALCMICFLQLQVIAAVD